MKVLIIKMTSMGDVIHLFPALTDAVNHCPDIRFDWVIEESFQELPKWHPAVDEIIPIAMRRWRRSPTSVFREPTLKNALTKLRHQSYDLVIDAQGLLKSALISTLARGPVAGLDWNSAREKSASLFYQQKHSVSPKQHAVTRMRQLFAKALAYPMPANIPDYGLQLPPGTQNDQEFLVFFSRHNLAQQTLAGRVLATIDCYCHLEGF
jgi:heptosyltransferase I